LGLYKELIDGFKGAIRDDELMALDHYLNKFQKLRVDERGKEREQLHSGHTLLI
jgi:hypothetical protein